MIVSLGSINADFVVRDSGEDFLRTSGGKAANVAVLSVRLGVPALLLGCVGDDDLAAQAMAGPSGEGVDVSGVQRSAGPTAYSSVVVPPDGKKTIVLAPNANDRCGPVAIDAPTGSVVVVDLEVTPSVAVAAARDARAAGLLTVIDPAPPDRCTDEVLGLADHLTPDHHEAEAISGVDATTVDGARAAAKVLRERGAGVVHVKLSDGGSVVLADDGCWEVVAPEVEVVDATGAGDAYTGALAWALHAGMAGPEAARVAVAASTIAVTGYGSQEAYPADRAALEAMVRRVEVRPA